MIITIVVVFILCLILYFFAGNEDKNDTGKKKDTAERTEEQSEEPQVESKQEWEESEYKLADMQVFYMPGEGINMQELFQKLNQENYFKSMVYEYLYANGFPDIKKLEVGTGEAIESEVTKFSVLAVTEKEEEIELVGNYNQGLLSYYFYFVKDELTAGSVIITNIDEKLQHLIGAELSRIEKQFGIYLFNEKLTAEKAKITHYEIAGDIVEIQVELDDEYKTYCKIYYNAKTQEYEFEKWG